MGRPCGQSHANFHKIDYRGYDSLASLFLQFSTCPLKTIVLIVFFGLRWAKLGFLLQKCRLSAIIA